jgi:hypothetical protein
MRSHGRSLAKVFILILFAVLVLLPLASQKGQAAAKELKVGALVNLKSPEGIEMQRWLNLFAKMYNEKGGWQIGNDKYQVKPMVYDCGYRDVAKTRSAADKGGAPGRRQVHRCDVGRCA